MSGEPDPEPGRENSAQVRANACQVPAALLSAREGVRTLASRIASQLRRATTLGVICRSSLARPGGARLAPGAPALPLPRYASFVLRISGLRRKACVRPDALGCN